MQVGGGYSSIRTQHGLVGIDQDVNTSNVCLNNGEFKAKRKQCFTP